MAQILVVEDHVNIGLALCESLVGDGYLATWAKTVGEAEAILKSSEANAFQLVILDWMLPDGQGLDILKSMKARGHSAPVIFLTARADSFDKVLALELGASDYVTKPFDTLELMARVRVRLRESSSTLSTKEVVDTMLKVGELQINRVEHRVYFRSAEISLVKKEFDLLALLAESPGKVFSRDEILNKVWGYDVFPTTRTVDTHILTLRQKLSDRLIETVRSVGYRLIEC